LHCINNLSSQEGQKGVSFHCRIQKVSEKIATRALVDFTVALLLKPTPVVLSIEQIMKAATHIHMSKQTPNPGR
jgi:hypothetical protein